MLRPVKEEDSETLYELLKARPSYINISHRNMPTFTEHLQFIDSEPYAAWYIIEEGGEDVGHIYLTRGLNEIGVFLFPAHHRKGMASRAIKELIEKHPKDTYHANISPLNNPSRALFKSLGFELCQHTYRLDVKNAGS